MLKLSHVKKTFNKGTVTEKRALTGVDLTLNDGDFVTVIGGNGAGKSTLLNMIAGVYPLDSGVIELDGTDISRLSESQRAKYLGRVFQDPMRGTAADMQIAENLALAKRRGQRRGLSWGVTKAEKDEYVELLKRLGVVWTRVSTLRSVCSRAASARHSPCSWPRSPSRACCCSTSTPRPSTPRRHRRCSI